MLPGSGGDTCQGLSLLGPAACLRLPQLVCTRGLQPLGVMVLFFCCSLFVFPLASLEVDYWEPQLAASMRPLWSVSAGCFEHQSPRAAVPTHLLPAIYSFTVCLLRA